MNLDQKRKILTFKIGNLSMDTYHEYILHNPEPRYNQAYGVHSLIMTSNPIPAFGIMFNTFNKYF